MINLHLAIYNGDIPIIPFETKKELIDYVFELQKFDCIWLFTTGCENGEIIVTENILFLIMIIEMSTIEGDIFIQEYQSYEDAYSVALDMKETNPKCYNND
jgi:hypothetical protein